MHGPIGAGRAIAFLLVAWLGMSVVASCQAVLPMRVLPGLRPGPDVAALVVLFVGLSRRGGPAGACAFAFALGYLADLSGGSPKGMHVLGLIGLVSLSRLASSRLMVRGAIFTTMVAAFFGGLYLLSLALLRVGLDPPSAAATWRGTLARVPLALLATSLFAAPVFAILHRVDRFFTRDPRALGGGERVTVSLRP